MMEEITIESPPIHAEGHNTKAMGLGSHAEGIGSQAVQTAAHAEGHNTIASNDGAHSEGQNTLACGFASHAGGIDAVAREPAQWARASGKFATLGDAQTSIIHMKGETAPQSAAFLAIGDQDYITIGCNYALLITLDLVVSNGINWHCEKTTFALHHNGKKAEMTPPETLYKKNIGAITRYNITPILINGKDRLQFRIQSPSEKSAKWSATLYITELHMGTK